MPSFPGAVTKHDMQEVFFLLGDQNFYIKYRILVTGNFLCPLKNTSAQAVRVRTECLRGKGQEVLPNQNENKAFEMIRNSKDVVSLAYS